MFHLMAQSAAVTTAYSLRPRPRPNSAQGLSLVQLLELQYELLGVQMIIDLERYRIWKVGRGWKAHPDITGGGEHRLHIETNDERWPDSVPIADRFPREQEPTMETMRAEGLHSWAEHTSCTAATVQL